MAIQQVESFVGGQWIAPDKNANVIFSAIDGSVIAQAGSGKNHTATLLEFAKDKGGTALRKLGFHDRAKLLKALATKLNDHREELYQLSFLTGATAKDHLTDIDGGIATVFGYASIGRRELPDSQVYCDGQVEQLSRSGSFLGQHIAAPRRGVAVQINAFNFPVWGMLEKLAPAILAGMPAIIKPATASCYVTEAAVRIIEASNILPPGSIQLITGSTGSLLDHLDCQDVVSFTGSKQTSQLLRTTPALIENSVRFIAEQDSLNASILAPDAENGSPEFDFFIKEVCTEITVKAGQKCTAIRRILVPQERAKEVAAALKEKLETIRIGDPRDPNTQMGTLISQLQKNDVLEKFEQFKSECDVVLDMQTPKALASGAFVGPKLLRARAPDSAKLVHMYEAFGPVSTIIPYDDLDHAVELANRGGGSLVVSLFTNQPDSAAHIALGVGAYHGRIYINNRHSTHEATGHGAPLPHLIHGGPGRAGGSEEMGGLRGVMQYMQRTAIQGAPDMLSAITSNWIKGAAQDSTGPHLFRRCFDDLNPGDTLRTDSREISAADIEHFAEFTGDTFYAHMDDEAAKRNPFFPGKVAHGYLLLSFAAGLFVDPDEGPVLANTGLDKLKFSKPVVAGDRIHVTLSVKQKTRRTAEYGEVRWHVQIHNQDKDLVAEYELLTMNAYTLGAQ
ncbi:MAG: phenylacetic acid degradation bifunctional protein PaaZ [Marinovum sp.]|nr:phenylacetic acid degradation bifunctional protein PaaZ [Marinovum sp.]